MEQTEYLQQPEARAALEELEEACFGARERGEPEDAYPEPAKFLRERGVEPPESGVVSIRHTVEEPGTKVEDLIGPMRPICPGGEDGCRPTNCKMINGEWVCSWVCHCP
jgi:hypothetical protein